MGIRINKAAVTDNNIKMTLSSPDFTKHKGQHGLQPYPLSRAIASHLDQLYNNYILDLMITRVGTLT